METIEVNVFNIPSTNWEIGDYLAKGNQHYKILSRSKGKVILRVLKTKVPQWKIFGSLNIN